MVNKKAFYIFLAGTLTSLAIFLGLTWDTHRQVDALTNADKLSEQVVAGKRVWEKKNCNLCHTILGFGVYYAPDVTKVHKRIGTEGIKQVVLQPEVVFKDSFRKMPNLGVTEQEATDLAAFLEWVSKIDNHDWPPQDSEERMSAAERRATGGAGLSRGAAAFQQNCIGCHSIGGAGGSIGPALDTIGATYDAATVAAYIAEPTSVDPQSTMPPQTTVSDDDRSAIGEFLAKQQ